MGQAYNSASYRDSLPLRRIWWWYREDRLILRELLQLAVKAVSWFLSAAVTNFHILCLNCTNVLYHCCLNEMSVCHGSFQEKSGYGWLVFLCESSWTESVFFAPSCSDKIQSFAAVGFIFPSPWLSDQGCSQNGAHHILRLLAHFHC